MKALLSLFILLIFTSCASKKEQQKIEVKAAQETTVTDSKTLRDSIHELIHTSKTFSPSQKEQLESIFAANKKRAEELSLESYKFRALLIKELLAGKGHAKEIKILKKNIRRIEADRLKNTFNTVEQVTRIVSGHPEGQEFGDQLILIERTVR